MTASAMDFTIRNLQDPKASGGVFKLPSGYLDKEGTLHREVRLREISGLEEDLLASSEGDVVEKLNTVMANCVVSLGAVPGGPGMADVIMDLPAGDRFFLLLALRAVSHGDEYHFETTCPGRKCGHTSVMSIRISDLEVYAPADPTVRSREFTLPSGRTARWRVHTGRSEAHVAEIVTKARDEAERAKNRGEAPRGEATLSAGIFVRLESLDSKPPTMADVQALGSRDRNALRQEFETYESGVETELEIRCQECGKEYVSEVDIAQMGFFFPSAKSRRSRRKSST